MSKPIPALWIIGTSIWATNLFTAGAGYFRHPSIAWNVLFAVDAAGMIWSVINLVRTLKSGVAVPGTTEDGR